MTNCNNLVLRTIGTALFLVMGSNAIGNHRVFPAAQIESYNSENLTPILGVLSNNDITFVVLSSSGPNQTRDAKTTPSASTKVEDFLHPAILRFKKSLNRFPDFKEDYIANPLNLPLRPISQIQIAVESSDVSLYNDVREDYKISIKEISSLEDDDGNYDDDDSFNDSNDGDVVEVTLKASTVFGALRALETFGQLLEFGWMENSQNQKNLSNDGNGGDATGTVTATANVIYFIKDIPLFISDEPSFPYRGLMIDTARHYLPMNLILDNLNAMAMNKMNVLHWHISDTESFPYEPKSLPELAEKGAYHPNRIYTVRDVQIVIQEAYLRGIRVIPEIDMPGHTDAIAKSHPEVMSHCPNPSSPINPTVAETFDFIEAIYKDLNDVFPDKFVHVGGDEVEFNEHCWLKDPSIFEWMKAHGMSNRTVDLYEYFETRLLKIVGKFQKTPIVWQEVFDLNLTIPQNTIIDVWKGFDRYTIQNATNQNFRVILSGCWYLDYLDHTWYNYYECDPRDFTGANKDLVIGGHASMWGEHTDASNFVSRVWPRASAVAERLWHGNVTQSGAINTIFDRIHAFRCRMVLQGFAAGPTGPGFCPAEVAYHSLLPSSENECGSEEPPREHRDGEVATSAAFSSIEVPESDEIEGGKDSEKSSWLR